MGNPRTRRSESFGSDRGSGSTKEIAKQQSQEVIQRTKQQASGVAEQGREQAESEAQNQDLSSQ